MEVELVADPAEFLERASPLLLDDEARNCLALGVVGTLGDHRDVYGEAGLWIVEDAETVVGAAFWTPPYNLGLAGPMSGPAARALAETIHRPGPGIPGVTGAVPEVEDFADAWERLADVVRTRRMAQRIFRLTSLRPTTGVPGRPRPATESDRPLLIEWLDAFTEETLPGDTRRNATESVIAARLRRGTGGFTLWEVNGAAVSLAGWGGRTPNGVLRIGPVYTPPELRGRGYGSAVTAAVTSERLAAGSHFCFLYTDLANPTSNRIYANIGYEPVCDSIDYVFDPR